MGFTIFFSLIHFKILRSNETILSAPVEAGSGEEGRRKYIYNLQILRTD